MISFETTRAALFDFAAAKIVLSELRPHLSDLYVPTVQAKPLEPVLAELDKYLMSMFDYIDVAFTKDALLPILRTLLSTIEAALLFGGERRSAADEDCEFILQDMEAIKDFFSQRDETGKFAGLSDGTIMQEFLSLHAILRLMEKPTAALMEQYATAPVETANADSCADKDTIIRVIARRPGKDAKKFVSRVRKLNNMIDARA